jgi:hydroxymethylbilane synthase
MIRLGTRGSRLALVQAQSVKEQFERIEPSVQVEIVTVRTKGDRLQARPETADGETGIFTKAIEDALLRGEVDVAVHSLKDLPTIQPEGLTIGAVPDRLDPHDVLVSRDGLTTGDLGKGVRVGTGSVRRRAQLLALNDEIEVVALRGNLDTRLRRVADGDFDAFVVAKAGLIRMQRDDLPTAPFPFDKMLPAAGQGALAVEVREVDSALMDLVAELDHAPSALTTHAERMVLYRLGAGCHVPVGVLAELLADGDIQVRCGVFSRNGRTALWARLSGEDVVPVVEAVVEDLVGQGVDQLIERRRQD